MNQCFKYFCASLMIFMSGVISAQERGCVTAEVTYEISDASGAVEVSGTSTVTFQDNAYVMIGDGVESYCDGTSVWNLDMVAKEAYIETLTPDVQDYMKEMSGRLSELGNNSEFSTEILDGQFIHVRVKSIKKADKKEISSFRPPVDFDSSWVVTDLR